MKLFSTAIFSRPADFKSAIVVGTLLAALAPAVAAPVTAKKADAFVDSK